MNASGFARWLMSWLVLAALPVSAANYTVVVGGVSGEDLNFSPKVLNINVGDTVTWQWIGNAVHAHNVVADGLFRCAQGCDGEGGNGDPSQVPWTVSRTFTTAGTVNYYCEAHFLIGMKGSIVVSASGGTPTASAVEYYYDVWNFYFETSFADEIAALDGGAFGGAWKRTGQTFNIWPTPAANPAALPTCRFFSTIFDPKSSHFYTPYAAECASLKAGTAWQFESIAFYIQLAEANGLCPAGTIPLYRAYNNGMGGAPNHRYTTSLDILNQMIAAGWIFEGDGNTKVFACVAP